MNASSASQTPFLNNLWEQGAGTNVSIVHSLVPGDGNPYMLHYLKDSTNKLVSMYINGRFAGSVSYSNEPTGGTTATFKIGNDPAGSGNYVDLAHVALWNGILLSEARIKAHAKAAGFY